MSVLYGVPPKTAKETVQSIQHTTLSPLDDDSLLEALAELSASTPNSDSASHSGTGSDSCLDSCSDSGSGTGACSASDSSSLDDFELQVKTIEPSNIPLHLNELSLHQVGGNEPDSVKSGEASSLLSAQDKLQSQSMVAAGVVIEAHSQARAQDMVRVSVGVGAVGSVGTIESAELERTAGADMAAHRVVVRNFTKLDDAALSYILRYRNSDGVRSNMLTTELLSLEGHLNFCHNLKQHPNKLYLLSAFDGYPMSVASIHADESWSRLLDYGMYAVGTAHPEHSATLEGRIPVYEIDRVVIAHLVLSRGIKAVDFQFKLDNAKSIYVNQNKLQTHVLHKDDKLLYTRLDCSAPASLYQKQLHDFCVKYHCTLEFDL